MKQRLDVALAEKGLVASRSQAESYVRLGQVLVNGHVASKPGQLVTETDDLKLTATEQFVSRAALKLKSAVQIFELDFKGRTVLDVGSSTGGFTQFALAHGAKKVVAVDVGTDQLHPSLRADKRIELHEKTDIRDLKIEQKIDTVLIDVSFVSLRDILPSVAALITNQATIVAMVKPQFEASKSAFKHKGVIKNDAMRRQILKDFESWVQTNLCIINKADSKVPGAKGNVERFYLLRKLA